MTPDQFRELCRGTCRQLDHSDTEALFAGAGLLIDGVRLGLFHDENIDPHGIYCFADLGEIDALPDASRVLEKLLSANLELNVARHETIGLEGDTRRLVLRARLWGDEAPAHEGYLAEQLRHQASVANELFETVLAGAQRPD